MLDEVRADGEKIEICVVWPDRFLGSRAADDFLELLPGVGGKAWGGGGGLNIVKEGIRNGGGNLVVYRAS